MRLFATRLNPGVAAALVLAVGVGTSAAHAQWTVVNLNPAGATYSVADAAAAGQQAGAAVVGGVYRAGLWSGTAESWVDLNPAGSTESEAYAMSGGQQAGYTLVGGVYRASVWSGTAGSWVDLNPTGSTVSEVFGVSGGQQAGYARVGGVYRASVWSGTAGSWVDLHPAGSTESIAEAAGGGQQAGYAVLGGVKHAGLWFGTAASWVDLHPAGATQSAANGASGGQQAGWAIVGGMTRASVWSGTAASWVDLNPAGSTIASAVYAASGGWQAGTVITGGAYHASVWSGTAASWVDLAAFLPAEFTSSVAYGLSSDGVNLYVAGYGYNSQTSRNEALLWVRPLPSMYTPCPPNMAGRVNYPAGISPNGIAVGDMNGDGKPDLITTTPGNHDGALLLGTGTGTFGSATHFGTGGGTPNGVATGDFNHDGRLDFVVSNAIGWVSVYFGDVNGTFYSGPALGNNAIPLAVATGDFNGDGHLDIAAASDNNQVTATIWFGDGAGGFGVMQHYGTGATSRHTAVAVGDFNGDGKVDLAVTNFNDTVSVLLGDNGAAFQFGVQYPVGHQPTGVATADFDGDGKLDLAVANGEGGATGNTISVLRGNGDGTFQPAVHSPTGGTGLAAVRAGDLNGDGKPDLVGACSLSGALAVLLGTGDGTFQPGIGLTAGGGTNSVAVADLNGDGRLDLACTNSGPDNVSVFLQLGTSATPVITQQPTRVSTTYGGTAQFDVSATGATSLTYRWRKNGVPLSDGPTITGAITTHLALHPVTCADDHAVIDCVVSNACGGTACNPATLFVSSPLAGWMTSGIGSPGFDNVPFAMVVMPNGDLIAGGGFVTAGGVPANGIARWNGAAWSALGSGIDGNAYALTVMPNGDVIAGGGFDTAGGVTVNGIARWNGTTWSALGSGMTGGDSATTVNALAVLANGDLVAAGNFATAGGITANHIARWNGTAWSALGAGIDGSVYPLAVMPNGDLVAVSEIDYDEFDFGYQVKRWNGTGWSVLGSDFNGRIHALAVMPNGDLIAGGGYSYPALSIARWNGTAWSALGSGVSGFVQALTVMPNGDLIAGGDFLFEGDGVMVLNLARCTGAGWSRLGGTNGPVYALAVRPNGDLIAGGPFSFTFGETPEPVGSVAEYSFVADATQPQSVVSCSGGSASFSVTSMDVGPLTYQWRKGGVPINAAGNLSAATGTLLLASISSADAGTYDCIISNTCGSVTSNAATLTVGPADLGRQGGLPGGDGFYDNNDFVVFINFFFTQDARADLGQQGGLPGSDGHFDNNDFVVFIERFFSGC